MALRDEWKTAKAAFETAIKGHLKPDDMKKLAKGADFGPALEKFDGGKDAAAKMALMPPVTKGKDAYVTALAAAEKVADAPGKEAIKKLRTALLAIYTKATDAAQPPKPLGRAKNIEIFYARNAAGGVRPKWMQLGAIDIKVGLVIDEVADQLLKSGEIGFTYVNFNAAVNEEVSKTTAAFKATIEGLDAKIATLAPGAREEKIKEANEVLVHYKKIVEANVNAIVDQKWAEFIGRRDFLKQFTKQCKIEVAVGVVTIAASAGSIALSLGTTALSLVAIAKAAVDIGMTLDKMSRDCDAAQKQLETQLPFVTDLVAKRAEAKKAGEGQKLAKAGEAVKEGATVAFGKISEKLYTTVSATTKTAKEFYGKISLLEADGGKMYKTMQEFAAKLPSDVGKAGPKAQAELNKLANQYNVMEQQFLTFNDGVKEKIEYGQSALTYCAKAKDADALPAFTKTAGAITGAGLGLYTAGKVLYATAMVLKGLVGA